MHIMSHHRVGGGHWRSDWCQLMSLRLLTDMLFLPLSPPPLWLPVCLLQQWETFSERSSSSQPLTQFASNIAPADPVSQSLECMHVSPLIGLDINLLRISDIPLLLSSKLSFSLCLSRSPFPCNLFSVAINAWGFCHCAKPTASSMAGLSCDFAC